MKMERTVHSFATDDSKIPPHIKPQALSDYFEIITRSAFNAGLSHRGVETLWPAMAEAMDDFDPRKIAAYGEDDINELMENKAIIQSRRKLTATVENARTFMDLVDAHNGFAGWLHSFDSFEQTSKALQKQFKYVGNFGAYWILYVLDEPRPDYEEWSAANKY